MLCAYMYKNKNGFRGIQYHLFQAYLNKMQNNYNDAFQNHLFINKSFVLYLKLRYILYLFGRFQPYIFNESYFGTSKSTIFAVNPLWMYFTASI